MFRILKKLPELWDFKGFFMAFVSVGELTTQLFYYVSNAKIRAFTMKRILFCCEKHKI
jgi:hypothetical protein